MQPEGSPQLALEPSFLVQVRKKRTDKPRQERGLNKAEVKRILNDAVEQGFAYVYVENEGIKAPWSG